MRVTGTIVDDDDDTATGHVISAAPVSVTEGDSGKTPMVFNVSLSGTPSHQVTLWAGIRVGGTAVQGEDFFLYHANRRVVFAAGASGSGLTQTVTVYVKGDQVDENDETFTLKLRDLVSDDHRVRFTGKDRNGTLNITGTIVDDDTAGVTIAPRALSIVEGSNATYTIRLNSAPTADVTVRVIGASGDVSVSSSELTFTPANWNIEQTVTVTAATDVDTITDPAVTLTHTASGGGYDSVTIGSVTVSITEPTPTPTTTTTTTIPISVPAAPTGLSVVPSKTGVVASWMPGVGSDCATTSYSGEIYLYDDVTGDSTLLYSDDLTVPSWTTSGLSPGTVYELDVFAYGSSCNEYSEDPATISFSTLPITPTAPTGVSVTVGDTEALISWSPAAVGDCASTEYYVALYDDDEELVAESDYMTSTSWFVDELTAFTKYELDVISYGNSCDEHSQPASAKFTTNASYAPTDPAEPTNRKLSASSSVRNLRVDTTTTPGKITISWDKPADIGNKRNKKCAYTANAGDHPDALILYSYYITHLATDVDGTDVELYYNSVSHIDSVTITLDLPDTVRNGDMLEVGVAAYSELCDSWSNVKTVEGTHTT